MLDLRKIEVRRRHADCQEVYFLPPDAPSSLGLEVRGVGLIARSHRERHPIVDRSFPGAVLIAITRGHAFFADSRQARTQLEAGACFLLHPESVHSYGVLPQLDYEERWIWLDGPRLAELRRHGPLDPAQPILHVTDPDWLQAGLTRALDAALSGDSQALARLPGLAHQVIDAIGKRPDESPSMPAHQAEACEQVRALLRDYPALPHDFRDLARDFGVSYSSLRLRFRQRYGISLVACQNRERITAASQLLVRGLSVSETAAAMGFGDVAYFSRLFKRLTGLPPVAYKGGRS